MTFPINRRRLYLAAWCHTSSPPARARAPSPRATAMSRAQQYNPLASDSQGAGAAAPRDVRVPLGLKLAHLCSYAGLIAVNVGANLGWFGKTNAEVSEEWPVPITPAGCVLRCVRVDGEGGRGKGGSSAAKKSTRRGFLFPSCAGAPLRGATGMRAGAEAPPRHASRPSRGALCPPRARGARRARREEMQKHQRRAWPPAPPPLARGGSGRAMALRPWPRMVHVLDLCEAGVREVAAARAARRQRA